MQYLKIWMSFNELIEPLSDDEVGRLLRMMLAYAESGEIPDTFQGNERYVWPAAKQNIDAAITKSETMSENGKKGGRPSKQTKANESKEKQTKANESLKVNVKDKDKVKVNDDMFSRFWSAYPRKESKPAAKRAFDKLKPDEDLMETMLTAIESQKQSTQWQENEGQFIPHPATWLNGHRWEDEVRNYKQTGKIKTVIAQQYTQNSYDGEQEDAERRWIQAMMEERA